jgi:hypothetical protein
VPREANEELVSGSQEIVAKNCLGGKVYGFSGRH